jgi:hypothetical protein
MELNDDKTKYKAWTWKHPSMLHWIINPALAFNELVLGQRIPKITLIDKISVKPLMERTLVPCPHCGTLHDGRIWSLQNKTVFKNWFGYYCPQCGEIIPCLWNLTSLLILSLTFPLWFWFRHRLKARWLAMQKKRFANVEIKKMEWKDTPWLKNGLAWGISVFIILTLIEIKDFSWLKLYIGVPLWLIAGLGYGYTMKIIMGKKRKTAK